ncbi:MAG TPA: Gfo/Idh/MocA family oxidoreductase [Actinomycetota bacterium]|jgi:predicted dehydrogenase|nr:Gfo/Idh/MocA family oxidoreductase [Actinomycetota bacterium]
MTRPRLGFLGVGWIGRNRMEAVARSGDAEVVCVADPDLEAAEAAAGAVGCTQIFGSLDDLLDRDLDGIVIATPSALHAEQCMAALESGVAVFCQKPLARTAAEAAAVVEAARAKNLLLGVDMSYRYVEAFRAAAAVVHEQMRGSLYAIELRFDNAYGPDKAWFLDPRLSGGGCVIDLGTHLIDVARWFTGEDAAVSAARLYRRGVRLDLPSQDAEDRAIVDLDAGGCHVRVECSWFLPIGVDARIVCRAYAPDQSVEVVNVGGSFYDFAAYHHTRGGSTELAAPPDAWGGRAVCAWTEALGRREGFDPRVEDQVAIARAIDAIYGRQP